MKTVQDHIELDRIVTSGTGFGADDNLNEMIKYYESHNELPGYTSDGSQTIERNFYQLQDLREQIRKYD